MMDVPVATAFYGSSSTFRSWMESRYPDPPGAPLFHSPSPLEDSLTLILECPAGITGTEDKKRGCNQSNLCLLLQPHAVSIIVMTTSMVQAEWTTAVLLAGFTSPRWLLNLT